jgi:DNA-binding PadR family transcriptional regulator
MRTVWPRAESAIYREPAKLVEAGYALSREVAAGPTRTKTEYAITAKGRRAFRRWLAESSAPPAFESEGLLRVLFADQGSLDDLRRTLAQISDQAEAMQGRIIGYAQQNAQGQGPFPDRIHVIALFGRFMSNYAATLRDGPRGPWPRPTTGQTPGPARLLEGPAWPPRRSPTLASKRRNRRLNRQTKEPSSWPASSRHWGPVLPGVRLPRRQG